jgi:hypothetical protein
MGRTHASARTYQPMDQRLRKTTRSKGQIPCRTHAPWMSVYDMQGSELSEPFVYSETLFRKDPDRAKEGSKKTGLHFAA